MYEPITLIKKSARGDDHFDATEFTKLISELNSDEFDKFCQRISYLTEYHDTSTRVVEPGGGENSKDPVAKWDAKGIEIDNGYKKSSFPE